jgi:hypothetical protein
MKLLCLYLIYMNRCGSPPAYQVYSRLMCSFAEKGMHIYIYIYIYMYIYMYVCIYINICIYIHVRTCSQINTYTYIHIYMYVCINVSIHIHIYVGMRNKCDDILTRMLAGGYKPDTESCRQLLSVHASIDLVGEYMYIYICIVCIYLYLCIYLYMFTYMYIYTYGYRINLIFIAYKLCIINIYI